MTVRELIAHLERMNPSARVLIASHPAWPTEHDLIGTVERRHVEDRDRDLHWESDDVLLLEGDKVGFGMRAAWDAAVAPPAIEATHGG